MPEANGSSRRALGVINALCRDTPLCRLIFPAPQLVLRSVSVVSQMRGSCAGATNQTACGTMQVQILRTGTPLRECPKQNCLRRNSNPRTLAALVCEFGLMTKAGLEGLEWFINPTPLSTLDAEPFRYYWPQIMK